MANLFSTLALQLISEKCYETYFDRNDFFNADCFKQLLSKVLGYAIVIAAIFIKVPQILKLLSSRSGEGINIYSILFELVAITLNLSYNIVNGFPFSSWGDVAFIGVQNIALVVLVLHYNGSTAKVILLLIGYASASYVLMGGLTSVNTLWSLQALNIPILIAAKGSQAYTNYSNGHTGQLSAITCFMMFFGTLARIFTSIQETGDHLIIFTYTLSTLSNGLILAQMLYYWNVEVATIKSKKDD